MTNPIIYIALEVAVFLLFSAAMWLAIKLADTGPDAGGPAPMALAQDSAARVEDHRHADQLVAI
jgi:hypothetical protein